MIEVHYRDAYKKERSQTFENKEAAVLAFSGCLTLPDYYPISSIIKDGKELDFKGTIGDLYLYLQTLD
ncbi:MULTISPECIES: DUF4649 family protein [Streptococcus]|uniref:DUF4649 domain-containing protein n=1 Tax=Streptococcus ruminantium TaxID=1917441 RepID=A0A2Z5TM70_9STRE|nr:MULTISPECIES: DUF4649 family protein [Streptococcus]MDQ8758786.1 DUF4649 family protein [Streptococcus ruminantium]MDQ8765895.1 DUF4649 family protein [Streptococcus ruminantium]MDQ8766606.1 DUF4649 family protein [Streptococcus ruminantium]MDQ8768295.1 DUF4649 family protein [Streptococcus ruminantium]MDQ8775118.1 DUF4649 family protein [Streptococcus ruminantium]